MEKRKKDTLIDSLSLYIMSLKLMLPGETHAKVSWKKVSEPLESERCKLPSNLKRPIVISNQTDVSSKTVFCFFVFYIHVLSGLLYNFLWLYRPNVLSLLSQILPTMCTFNLSFRIAHKLH